MLYNALSVGEENPQNFPFLVIYTKFLIYHLYQPCLRIMLVCKASLLCSYMFTDLRLFFNHRVYLYCLVAVCQPFIKLMIEQEIRSVEHGICPIAEFTSPY